MSAYLLPLSTSLIWHEALKAFVKHLVSTDIKWTTFFFEFVEHCASSVFALISFEADPSGSQTCRSRPFKRGVNLSPACSPTADQPDRQTEKERRTPCGMMNDKLILETQRAVRRWQPSPIHCRAQYQPCRLHGSLHCCLPRSLLPLSPCHWQPGCCYSYRHITYKYTFRMCRKALFLKVISAH